MATALTSNVHDDDIFFFVFFAITKMYANLIFMLQTTFAPVLRLNIAKAEHRKHFASDAEEKKRDKALQVYLGRRQT